MLILIRQMNSRTIHSALIFLSSTLFLIAVAHVHAQQNSELEDSLSAGRSFNSELKISHEKAEETYTQLPILMTDVGAPHKASVSGNLSPTPTKTIKTTPTPTVEITPTTSSTPTSTPKPTSKPETKSISNQGGLDADKLFNMSNEYRRNRGLKPFVKDQKTCELAHSRAPEIAQEVKDGKLHAGLQSRNLDYWNTENIISMSTEESAFNWWINDKIHHDAIVGDFKYSCVACHGNSCAQEFTNYQPK